jgi:hypothetical protein
LFAFPAFGTSKQPPEVRVVVYEQLYNRWMALSLASLVVGALFKAATLALGLIF